MSKKKRWVSLNDIRIGAIFENKSRTQAFKGRDGNYSLKDGEPIDFESDTLVRESRRVRRIRRSKKEKKDELKAGKSQSS